MPAKLDREAIVAIRKLADLGQSNSVIARQFGVTEGTVRYHRKRASEGHIDGRSLQPCAAAPHHAVIADWVGLHGSLNLADLHEFLVAECRYEHSLRSVQRYVARTFPQPRTRSRRRVETPPGAQAQVDWATFNGVRIGQRDVDLLAFLLQLSHSRFNVCIWSERKDLLAWLDVHNRALRFLGGVPAVLRVDNEKTAVSRGAGAWGEINRAYRRYAETARFHVDACPPRQPQTKGKVERRVRDLRKHADPRCREWRSLEELQEWSFDKDLQSAQRRRCPATGTSVWDAFVEERRHLGPLPILPEPFDLVATRRVGRDCLVSFERRQYSVPFEFVDRSVEVRGCAQVVQIFADARIVAEHPRHTRSQICLDERHYEGESTDRVLAPAPLGRMGRRLQEIAALAPEARSVDLYDALSEVAR